MQPVLVALRLGLARQRRDGAAFKAAWAVTLPHALDVASCAIERELWLLALRGTADAWSAAYVGAAPAPDARACELLEAA